jgi:hypothetical protein
LFERNDQPFIRELGDIYNPIQIEQQNKNRKPPIEEPTAIPTAAPPPLPLESRLIKTIQIRSIYHLEAILKILNNNLMKNYNMKLTDS